MFTSAAQTPFLEVPNDLSRKNYSVENAFTVVNDENNTFATFLTNENSINAYLYSQNLEPLSKFASKGLSEGYDEIIGKTIKDGQIRLFFKEYYNKKFGAVLFDFERGQSIETEFGFKLKDEVYLQSHSYQDNFYIITVNKKSSILNVYTFEHAGKFGKKSFDFTESTFLNRKDKLTTLFHLLTEPINEVPNIQETNANSIDITSSLSKLYDRGSKFVLTMDGGLSHTYLFEFNLSELSAKNEAIENLTEVGDETFSTNNSYLFKDKIFQIGANKKIMIVTIKDLETKKELKRLTFSRDEEIPFKNSSIIEEQASKSSTKVKELEDNKYFFKIFRKGNSGITVAQKDNNYQITMGGSEEINKGGAFVGATAMMGGQNNVGSFATSFNPTSYAFDHYKKDKSVRIESLFNQNFEHIDGEIPQNSFDKLRAYTLQVPKAKAETVFRMNDFIVYGRYFSSENIYKFFKFSE